MPAWAWHRSGNDSGEFKPFSAVCTHLGCIVNKIGNGTIDCPCHGSMYSVKDGHVVHGPAPKPLRPSVKRVTRMGRPDLVRHVPLQHGPHPLGRVGDGVAFRH